MEEEKKMCPGCKCMKLISDFYGLRKSMTTKCIVCNKRASKYIRKLTILKNEEKKYNLSIQDIDI
jgi:hypothetical protein